MSDWGTSDSAVFHKLGNAWVRADKVQAVTPSHPTGSYIQLEGEGYVTVESMTPDQVMERMRKGANDER